MSARPRHNLWKQQHGLENSFSITCCFHRLKRCPIGDRLGYSRDQPIDTSSFLPLSRPQARRQEGRGKRFSAPHVSFWWRRGKPSSRNRSDMDRFLLFPFFLVTTRKESGRGEDVCPGGNHFLTAGRHLPGLRLRPQA